MVVKIFASILHGIEVHIKWFPKLIKIVENSAILDIG